jgi:hypothetical protein
VRKRLKEKGIEEVEEVKEIGKRVTPERGAGEATVRRVITGYGRIDCRICQDIK